MLTSFILAYALSAPIGVGPTEARYALVVGSNAPGRGQAPLRYAEDDAKKVAGILREIGGYATDRVWTLAKPSRRTISGALMSLRQRLERHAAAGEQATVVFFYSGHARTGGLTLGEEELSFSDLRDELARLPATLKLVVLDACQSGEFSRVKGAVPAAEFSHNAVSRLQVEGFAVMASSTATELSQESDKLGGSYFTHHLLVGLRGAGDADKDGQVTLSEAYRYAYAETLFATASTQVGEQHVTLETDLKGKGEVAITYPARATAILAIDGVLAGTVLVQREPSRSVIAELHKAAGEEIALALPPGAYVATVKDGARLLRCPITLEDGKTTALAAAQCNAVVVAADAARTKQSATAPASSEAPPPAAFSFPSGNPQQPFVVYGAAPPPMLKPRKPPRERFAHFALTIGIGGMRMQNDGYSKDLGTFSFVDNRYEQVADTRYARARFHMSAAYNVNRYFAAVLFGQTFDDASYTRTVFGGGTQKFSWATGGIGAAARGQLWIADGYFNPYLQLGAGIGFGRSRYDDIDPGVDSTLQKATTDQTHVGWFLQGALGTNLVIIRNFGLFVQLDYTYAPIIKNLLGRTHDSGGFGGAVGVRVGL